MGGFSNSFKNATDPFHTVTNRDQPVTLSGFTKSLRQVADPIITDNTFKLIQKHNNTQDNLRGTLDPAQWTGANSTQAPPPNPNAPGSIMNMGGVGGNGQGMPFNRNIGVPGNGVSTNGLQQPQMQIGQPQGYFNQQGGTPNFGLQNGQQNSSQGSPNWNSIIAQALQGPTRQTVGQPVGPRFNT